MSLKKEIDIGNDPENEYDPKEKDNENYQRDVTHRSQKIEEILYEVCSESITEIKKYVYENSIPIAENLSYSDLYDFMRS